MNNALFTLTSIFFAVSLLGNAISFLNLLESRDYNAKRLFIYLRETKGGRRLLIGKIALLKWIVIFGYITTVFYNIDAIYNLLVFGLYLLLFLNVARHIKNGDLSFPNFTKGIVIALIFTGIIETALFLFTPLDSFLWLLIIDKLLLPILSLFLIILAVFSDFGRDYIINRAIGKISKHPKLLSIAVVGSFGRGSTKEFISRILALKYSVLTEHSSFSNSVGIARTINSGLNSKSQIFIAEINDFASEDVREMCALINPKIVVVSGINEQKISLFGNMDNIISSKLEAVNSLGRDGIALFNGNSEYIKDMIKATKKKKFIYSLYGKWEDAAIVAKNVKESRFNISFDIIVLGKKYKLPGIKLLGRQNIENLLPAIFIGVYAGIDFFHIRDALMKLTPLEASMEPSRAKSGAVLIDDTHNANINSVIRATSYAKLYRGKKILVLEPLVELGKKALKIHRDLGEEIGKVFNVVYLTNDNFYPAISAGVSETNSECEVEVVPPSKVINFVKNESKREDVIIFEGHETVLSLSKIAKEKVYENENK